MMDPASCAQRPRARRYEFTTRPDGAAAGRLAIDASPLAPVPDPRGRIVLSGGGLVGQPLLGDDDSKRYLVKASHFERMPEVVEPRGGRLLVERGWGGGRRPRRLVS